jgi:tRNA(Arg) A34 adenosine deaminase TadA
MIRDSAPSRVNGSKLNTTRADRVEGYYPFGCVIVRDGEVIGEGCANVGLEHDPTGHGEIVAIRDACKRLKTVTLKGCDLYTSCEPCSLCVSAIWLAKIDKVYYGAAIEDTLVLGADFSPLRTEVGKPINDRDMPAEQVLGDQGRTLLEDWAKVIQQDQALQADMQNMTE